MRSNKRRRERRSGAAGHASAGHFGRSQKTAANQKTSICPLSGSRLGPGQRVRTAAFPGEAERLVYVYGCPLCFGDAASHASAGHTAAGHTSAGHSHTLQRRLSRRCPVCRRELSPESYAVGRMWDGEDKTYLRVMGCPSCRRL